MFQAVGLRMEGDYLDLSYGDTSSWTPAGPELPLPNQWIVVGDADTGPTIMLGAPGTFPQDFWMDTHYHGSDQFRVVLQGEYLLMKHRMKAGDFGYQESGRTYREGLSSAADPCWIFAMHGTWRGARGTQTRGEDGNFNMPRLYENQLDRFAETTDDPCWWNVAGGSKGIAAVKTTLGPNRGGYAWGSFSETDDWRSMSENVRFTTGMFGLPATGPILFTIKADEGSVVVPSAVCGTEIVCAVIRGSIEIGDKQYQKGDVRIQRDGVPLDAVVSGSEGVEMIYLIADRRHLPQMTDSSPLSQRWSTVLDGLVAELAVEVPVAMKSTG